MSKELTEQWRNGTYYIENKSQSIKFVEIDYYNVFGDTRYWSGCDDEDIEEVLAPVPSYEQDKLKDDIINDLLWKLELSVQTEVNLTKKVDELTTKCSRLEEQQKDCIETLKFYAEMKHCSEAFDNQGCGRDYWINEIENGIYHLEGYYPIEVGQKAKEYLKKWGVK